MRTRILTAAVIFTVLIFSAVLLTFLFQRQANSTNTDTTAERILALNEISQLTKSAVTGKDSGQLLQIDRKISDLENQLRKNSPASQSGRNFLYTVGIGTAAVLFIWFSFLYIYVSIFRPFEKMKIYAGKIASGDFDQTLGYERSNYFGDFTWAFDHMRREIVKARSCEKEAIENNKTVIAAISHDIKTPIASICAYSEGLEANMEATPEKRAHYLGVIIRKCNEAAKLTDDLLLHSLSDLDRLKINPEPVEIDEFLSSAVGELSAEKDDVFLYGRSVSGTVRCDRKRLLQIFENLINNSRKYAKTRIDISAEDDSANVQIRFRDYGKGIPDEDMPFIFDKFYRGKNCGGEQGSGLGLYIVKYILDQMDGSIELINHTDGLEVILSLLRIS